MDEHGLYDIYPLIHQPWFKQAWFRYSIYALLLSILVGVIALVVYVIFTSRRRTIWEHSLERLSLDQNSDLKQEAIRSCSILKHYLITRFSLAHHGLTDDELLSQLEQLTDSSIQMIKHEVADVFGASRLIKFSAHSAQNISSGALREKCIGIIKQTIPSEHTK